MWLMSVRLVELSEKKRTEYETHQVVFWRKAKDSAQKQLPFFRRLVGIETTIAFATLLTDALHPVANA
jgi:hypothetical protein